MLCSKDHEMHQEDVITHRATSPLDDDQLETMWWCDKCQEGIPLEEGSDEL